VGQSLIEQNHLVEDREPRLSAPFLFLSLTLYPFLGTEQEISDFRREIV